MEPWKRCQVFRAADFQRFECLILRRARSFYPEVKIEATKLASKPLRYEFASGKLTLFLRNGEESHLEVVEEPEGAIKARRADGQAWSMVRLAAPKPFSLAFVDAAGALQRLDAARRSSGAAADGKTMG